ncbi:MAG: amidohydrolase [Acidobacteriota bacterium]
MGTLGTAGWIARCGCRMLGVYLMIMAACTPDQPPDLILVNGRIVTMDASQPEVAALAVRGGRIQASGASELIREMAGPGTRILDLRGRLATPGWIESHAHFSGLGEAGLRLDLAACRSWEEIVDLVAEAARRTPPGEWIVGGGWHQEKWSASPQPNVEGLPLNDSLSRVSPDHPVLLEHASGHAAIANARAMERAGIGPSTPDPPGGTILRDGGGRPTGVLRENAAGLVEAARARDLAALEPAAQKTRRLQVLDHAVREVVSHGITTFHDAGASFEDVAFYREAAAAGRLPVRLYVMLSEPNERLAAQAAAWRTVGAFDHHLTVRAVKRYIDGALGSHGAWLKAPYADLPVTGLNTTPLADLEAAARIALEQDLQLCVHAIGDRANAEVLALYARVLGDGPEGRQRRWRIEHAQHLDPAEIPLFAGLGVVAAMQAIHAVSDGPWVPLRIGELRAREGAYVWRRLLDAGVVIANGTDAPVEPIDPIACFHASVTRQMQDGRAFFPEQAMSREEALASYTWAGAYAAFEEDIKGSLTPGKLADITVFSQDLLRVPESEIRATKVVYTIVGGEVVYEAGD